MVMRIRAVGISATLLPSALCPSEAYVLLSHVHHASNMVGHHA